MKLLFDENNIDLHMHSEYSDGEEEVEVLCNTAIKKGLKIISITDHDTMKGYKEIDFKYWEDLGLKIIPGVEMTVMYNNHRVHALAYGINPNLFNILKFVYYKKYKGHRHKYISMDGAYRLTHQLGGKLILAHPYKYSRSTFKGEELVKEAIKDKLIDGIECFHGYHTKEETETLLKYAENNDLYVTAGSDFHNLGKNIRDDVFSSESLGILYVQHRKISDAISEYRNKKR